MNLEPIPKQLKKSPFARRSTLKPSFRHKPKKSHRFSTSNDDKILRVYCRKQSIQLKPAENSIQTPKPKRLEHFETRLKKLPEIKKSVTPSTQFINLFTKEDKLHTMIDNFIVNRSPKPRYTRIRDKLKKSLEISKDDLDNLLYEKNIMSYRGKEFKDYKNSIQKNIKIEKLRSQNHRRLKKKLKEL